MFRLLKLADFMTNYGTTVKNEAASSALSPQELDGLSLSICLHVSETRDVLTTYHAMEATTSLNDLNCALIYASVAERH